MVEALPRQILIPRLVQPEEKRAKIQAMFSNRKISITDQIQDLNQKDQNFITYRIDRASLITTFWSQINAGHSTVQGYRVRVTGYAICRVEDPWIITRFENCNLRILKLHPRIYLLVLTIAVASGIELATV